MRQTLPVLAILVFRGLFPSSVQGQFQFLPEEFALEEPIEDYNDTSYSNQEEHMALREELYDLGSDAFVDPNLVAKARPYSYEPRVAISSNNKGPAFKFDYNYSGVTIEGDSIIIDSTWLQIAPYYGIWDSYHVNPYKVDPVKFKDTLPIYLCDTANGRRWCMPQKQYRKTSVFGPRGYRFHYGVDIKLHTGDTIRSVWDGVVRVVSYDRRGYGNYLVVRHLNGLETVYGHLSRRLVKPGQYVKAGECIGLGGSTGRSTGPHLHFEVRYEGNPINPEELFDFDEDWTLKSEFFLLTPQMWNHIREMRRVVYHRIRPGDTLGHIAGRYRTSITRICRLNGIRRSTTLRVGRRLRVR